MDVGVRKVGLPPGVYGQLRVPHPSHRLPGDTHHVVEVPEVRGEALNGEQAFSGPEHEGRRAVRLRDHTHHRTAPGQDRDRDLE